MAGDGAQWQASMGLRDDHLHDIGEAQEGWKPERNAGVVSNISQCQIALICAIARARSRSLVRRCLFNIYFFGYVTFR